MRTYWACEPRQQREEERRAACSAFGMYWGWWLQRIWGKIGEMCLGLWRRSNTPAPGKVPHQWMGKVPMGNSRLTTEATMESPYTETEGVGWKSWAAACRGRTRDTEKKRGKPSKGSAAATYVTTPPREHFSHTQDWSPSDTTKVQHHESQGHRSESPPRWLLHAARGWITKEILEGKLWIQPRINETIHKLGFLTDYSQHTSY